MADESCTINNSLILLMVGSVIGATALAMMLQDCKKRAPKMKWLKLGSP